MLDDLGWEVGVGEVRVISPQPKDQGKEILTPRQKWLYQRLAHRIAVSRAQVSPCLAYNRHRGRIDKEGDPGSRSLTARPQSNSCLYLNLAWFVQKMERPAHGAAKTILLEKYVEGPLGGSVG